MQIIDVVAATHGTKKYFWFLYFNSLEVFAICCIRMVIIAEFTALLIEGGIVILLDTQIWNINKQIMRSKYSINSLAMDIEFQPEFYRSLLSYNQKQHTNGKLVHWKIA